MTYDLLKQILQDNPLTEELVQGTGDGRLDSALSEQVVINHWKSILPT